MRYVTAAFCVAGAMMAAHQAVGQADPVVVELYTSQGCSSCPPADELLRELASRGDVIPLALHVDYWDYIGWPDSFAQPHFANRQRQYARVAGERMVYTPQMVVGGVDHVIGTDMMTLMDGIAAHAALPRDVSLTLQRNGDVLRIDADRSGDADGVMLVQLVRYDPEETVEIAQGENAGRTISYTNIVTSWEVLGRWDGAASLSIEAQVLGRAPVVVIIQEEGPGLVLAAQALR